MKFTTDTPYIRALELEDLEPLLELRLRNRAFLQLFEPTHVDANFTKDGLREMVQNRLPTVKTD